MQSVHCLLNSCSSEMKYTFPFTQCFITDQAHFEESHEKAKCQAEISVTPNKRLELVNQFQSHMVALLVINSLNIRSIYLFDFCTPHFESNDQLVIFFLSQCDWEYLIGIGGANSTDSRTTTKASPFLRGSKVSLSQKGTMAYIYQ